MKKPGSVSFILIHLRDLNQKVGQDGLVPVRRLWAEMTGLKGETVDGRKANPPLSTPAKLINLDNVS